MNNKQLACPECKSTNLFRFGIKFHRGSDGKREKIQQYQCKKCGRITVKPTMLPPRDTKGRFTSTKSLIGLESNPSASGDKGRE